MNEISLKRCVYCLFRVYCKVFGISSRIFMVSNYSDNISADDIYANGILNHYHRTSLENDWFDYLKLAIENSINDLEAEGGVLSESVDVNGKIREKYTIMIDFF